MLVALPLTSSFLLDYSLIPEVLQYKLPVGQRTWSPDGQGLEQAIQISFHAGKLQMKPRSPIVFINSNDSSTDSKKTATVNGSLQPEIESNEYSSTRGSPYMLGRRPDRFACYLQFSEFP